MRSLPLTQVKRSGTTGKYNTCSYMLVSKRQNNFGTATKKGQPVSFFKPLNRITQSSLHIFAYL